ncbi:MAG: thiolase [Gammaproteobacteria bacterium]|nr:thiolase [Gammaproteobacteria bacterium]
MTAAADAALADAGLERNDIGGLIVGYATTMPHLMLANVFAEHYGLQPQHAHAAQAGGATGAMMLVLARHLAVAAAADNILVVAGENRLTGQTRNDTVKTLAQVGHPTLEVPTGATVPAYYALLAARYLHDTGCTERDLAELAVLMRRHAGAHPGAHLRAPIDVETVLASRPIAPPLKLLDCCPISDGAAAFVVSRNAHSDRCLPIAGWGEAHTHQHISSAPADVTCGARRAAGQALARAGRTIADVGYLGIYDSFTATVAMLLESTGFAQPGRAGRNAAEGRFSQDGQYPLNLDGGVLSHGHCGVGGGMAVVAEAMAQLRGEAGARQIFPAPRVAFTHVEGGVLSAHVSLVLEALG